MPQKVRVKGIDDLIDTIDAKLKEFKLKYKGLTLREKILLLVKVGYDTRCLNVSVAHAHGYSPSAALDRLRQYFIDNVMVKLNSTELDVVSGISDFARRIRELRVVKGYRIFTGASADPLFAGLELKPDEYILASLERDLDAARRWLIANKIRRMKASSKDKILEFLKQNVGEVVTTDELAYVSKDKKEFARRTRELRTEEGYAIYTKVTGRPDLEIGQYILVTLDRIAEPHDRKIKVEVQREVYLRDENKCRACGWTQARWTKEDSRILELHHLLAHAKRGENTAKNLVVLCSRCHDEVHAKRLDISHIKNN